MDFKNQDTLLCSLSSAIQSALTAVNSPELLNAQSKLLSALQFQPNLSEIDNLVNQLTSIPLHPYERLMWEHFEPDYKFKTINDVKDPEIIPVEECLKFITNKEQELNKTLFHNLTCCPEQRIMSGFESLSGDEVVCNHEKQKKYLEFFEMVRRIPINSITPQNSTTIINKLISEYMKVI
jgi:hypothetical protein